MKNHRMNLTLSAGLLVMALGILSAGCGSSGKTASGSGTGSGSSESSNNPHRPAVTAAGNTATGNTITIGLVASQTGDQKPWGDDSVAGAQLALSDFNKTGGIPGKKIVLDIQDSQSTPQGAGNAAAKLISDGAIGIVGEVSSGNTIEIANRAYAAGVPVVAIGATKSSLTEIGNNVFRVCYQDSFQGAVMATFAYNELGLRKIAVLTDNKLPYSQGLSADFIKTFDKLGGTICDQEMYETGASSFTTQLTNIKASNPDAVFCSGYFTEVGPIVSAATQMGLDVKFLGGDGWDSPKILESGGTGIYGDYFCNHYTNMDKSPAVQNFLKEWVAIHKTYPGTTMAALSYDAMKVTLDALKRSYDANASDTKSHGLNSRDLLTAIANTKDLQCVSGTITLAGTQGTPDKRALVVQIVKMTNLGFQKPVVAYKPGPDNSAIKVPLGGANE